MYVPKVVQVEMKKISSHVILHVFNNYKIVAESYEYLCGQVEKFSSAKFNCSSVQCSSNFPTLLFFNVLHKTSRVLKHNGHTKYLGAYITPQ